MAKVGQAQVLSRFKKVDFKTIKLQTDIVNIKGLFSEATLEPENLKPAQHDPNSIYIAANHEQKKKKPAPAVRIGKQESHDQNEEHEERHKVYRPGPFALFYQMNQGSLNKDDQVWYYKDNKTIFGPVSSYNMDKMVYFKTVEDQTKVAFKAVDKFVKFKKIKSIVEQEKGQDD